MLYNSAGQLSQANADIADASHPQSVLGAITYTPLGSVYTVELGAEYGQASQYDQRGRMTARASVNLSGDAVLGDTWSYDPAGNVLNTNDSAQGYFNYTYDHLNRVSTGTSPAASTSYGYDPWGNQTSHTVTAGSSFQWSYMPTTQNRATNSGALYDVSGNMTADGMNTYSYDAENRLYVVGNGNIHYLYDPEGMRVAVEAGNTITAEYLYDFSNNLVTTLNPGGTMVRGILRANGVHWGDYIGGPQAGAGRTEFRLVNQVGTLVANGDSQGNYVEGCLSGPFGDGQICTPSYDYTETHFTDKLRDQESNLDYFGARHFSSTLGRFMSPDPSGLFYADPTNPQSLNLYSYGRNNPLTNTDPTGLDCVYFNDAGNQVESVDRNSGSGECGSNGGDYVNGTTSASQIQYNATSDTFKIQSSSTFHNYNSTAYAPGPGGGGNGVPCSGNCDTANSYSSSLKIPNFTVQLGLAGNVQIQGPLTAVGSVGLIMDSHGRIGSYFTGGGGVSAGAGASAGVQVGASNGHSLCDYGGPFDNISLTGGAGAAGTVDGFVGNGGPDRYVSGGSLTVGGGIGAAASVTFTGTKVVPFGGARCQ